MRLYELPISFLCRMTAREAPSVPPRTVSFKRLRRALGRKICSLSSFTFFSRERRRTELAASPLATGEASEAGAPPGAAAGADGAPEAAGAAAGRSGGGGAAAGGGAPAAAGAGVGVAVARAAGVAAGA